ncbi:MAG TPA: CRISPR-associated endonuclease Cas3'' [candidate division Zixibacteria bacterium]|nr:CRISPR-associated endonuclease Cas3'' [candidate division Zixibacteria bacterium]
MTEPLAHSAKPEFGIDAQTYREHVENVVNLAEEKARAVAKYMPDGGERLIEAVRLAAEFHDLGKLDEKNQEILSRRKISKHLPIAHWDAGAAYLKSLRRGISTVLALSHHTGLPDFPDENVSSPDSRFRVRDNEVWKHTDSHLQAYLDEHCKYFSNPEIDGNPPKMPSPLFFRFALSCLVDADHGDTARHYNGIEVKPGLPLEPSKRLKLLDDYVAGLSKGKSDERTRIRVETYDACRKAEPNSPMFACDSPVGTGKTTAVMAHLLRSAEEKGLRRIFVVLPFTNIIDQSVETYRKALVNIGEDANDIVAAHHHRADFGDEEDLQSIMARQYSFLWHAPIVVTTAVQFFETLASNRTSALRKIHNLSGSAIFIDESHAALPPELWPQAWLWLKELTEKWGCHFVLGSGSLTKVWQIEEIVGEGKEEVLPDLIQTETREKAASLEGHRIDFRTKTEPMGLDEVIEWTSQFPGPRLLIVNTVQSAACIARAIAQKSGRETVEHLSTALSPKDRARTLDKVKARLADKSHIDWTLVATSCVEAGVDLSFRTGFRERCSLNSILQIAGRVNRGNEFPSAEVWDFSLRFDSYLKRHPQFDDSSMILESLFEKNLVNPDSCTDAIKQEIRRKNQSGAHDNEIAVAERNQKFPDVEEKFKVINSNTETVIVDKELVEKLKRHEKFDKREIQNNSVQIWWNKLAPGSWAEIEGYSGLLEWTQEYNDFLGYMAGIIPLIDFQEARGGNY